MLAKIKDIFIKKIPFSANRSSRWSTVRKQWLETNNKCACCGGTKSLEVHHKKPFHLHPELELNTNNLITLCESKKNGLNCHLLMGHLGNYSTFNPDVDKDVQYFGQKIQNRSELTKQVS